LIPTCKEVSILLSQSLDGPLPLIQRVRMRAHLFVCSLCRRYRRQLYFLQRAARQWVTHVDATADTALPEEARRRLRARLQRRE